MLLCCFYVVKTNWGMISSRIFSTRKDKGTNNCCALNTLTNLKQKSDKNIIFVFVFVEVKQQQLWLFKKQQRREQP